MHEDIDEEAVAFQANDAGSIPAARSRPFSEIPRYLSALKLRGIVLSVSLSLDA